MQGNLRLAAAASTRSHVQEMEGKIVVADEGGEQDNVVGRKDVRGSER